MSTTVHTGAAGPAEGHERIFEVAPPEELERVNGSIQALRGIGIVVDGAGIPFGGCTHGVAWYSRQLAVQTMAALLAE